MLMPPKRVPSARCSSARVLSEVSEEDSDEERTLALVEAVRLLELGFQGCHLLFFDGKGGQSSPRPRASHLATSSCGVP
jgi:hypothetical protein